MPNDILGQEIKEGDYITYPGRSGSCLWMNFAKVVKIEEQRDEYLSRIGGKDINVIALKVINTQSTSGKISSVLCLDRVVKLGPEAIKLIESRKNDGN